MRIKYANWKGKEYYSPTQLQSYQDNPRNYYHQFVNVSDDGKPIPSQIALLFGDAVHETCLEYFLGKRVKGKEITKKQLNNYFNKKFRKNLEESTFNENEKTASLSQIPLGQVMACAFYDKAIKENWLPSYIEKELAYEINGFTILNTIDLLDINKGYIDTAIVRDLKTSSKPYSKGKVFSTFQLRSYAYAVEKTLGITVEAVEFIVVTKSMKPQVIRYKLPLINLSGWQDDFAEDVAHILRGIKAGIFPRKYDNYLLDWYSFVEEDWKYKNYYELVDEKYL